MCSASSDASTLANSFFTSVVDFGGFSGVAGIDSYTPGLVGNPNTQPARLYYIGLVLSVVLYIAIRYLVRTPFGLALQGIRDEPVRMRSLGYNVPLHRTLAFGFGAGTTVPTVIRFSIADLIFIVAESVLNDVGFG